MVAVMGIDIEIYIRTEPTPEALAKVRALANARNEDSSCRYPVIKSVGALHDRDGADRPCINISSASRYFGEHYPRGWWPSIREALIAIREVCPGADVEYGGDSSDCSYGEKVTDEFIARLDALWERTGKS
jgi:hypothetical protein